MIQRKQTLFLLQLIFLGVALLFISVNTVVTATTRTTIYLTPISNAELTATTSHWVAIGVNFLALALSVITIFLYKKRELQLKLCYALAALWFILSVMIAAFPFVLITSSEVVVEANYFGCVIGAFAILAAILAARFIKKDIALLKSADRIR